MPETLNRCKEAGFDGHLTKPLSLGGLQETIARWLPIAPTTITPLLLDEEAMTRTGS
jgi:CheY-like chemotaxis protein